MKSIGYNYFQKLKSKEHNQTLLFGILVGVGISVAWIIILQFLSKCLL
jgi:uncharacterized membrane protein YciS (DUF1049 family)